MISNQKNIILLGTIGLLILGVVALYFFFFKAVVAKNTEAQNAHYNVVSEDLKNEEISKIKRDIKQTQNDRDNLLSHFVKETEAIAFLETIESYGKSTNTNLEILSVNPTNDEHPALVLSMRTTGSFSNVYRFISLLENLPYAFEFSDVSIRNSFRPASVQTSAPVLGEGEKVAPAQSSTWEGIFTIRVISFIKGS